MTGVRQIIILFCVFLAFGAEGFCDLQNYSKKLLFRLNYGNEKNNIYVNISGDEIPEGPSGFYVDSKDCVYFNDSGKIKKFSPKGELLMTIDNAEQYMRIYVDEIGNIYCGEIRYTPDGKTDKQYVYSKELVEKYSLQRYSQDTFLEIAKNAVSVYDRRTKQLKRKMSFPPEDYRQDNKKLIKEGKWPDYSNRRAGFLFATDRSGNMYDGGTVNSKEPLPEGIYRTTLEAEIYKYNPEGKLLAVLTNIFRNPFGGNGPKPDVILDPEGKAIYYLEFYQDHLNIMKCGLEK